MNVSDKHFSVETYSGAGICVEYVSSWADVSPNEPHVREEDHVRAATERHEGFGGEKVANPSALIRRRHGHYPGEDSCERRSASGGIENGLERGIGDAIIPMISRE